MPEDQSKCQSVRVSKWQSSRVPKWAAPTYSIVLIRWWYSSIELKWYRWQLGFQNHYMVHRQLRLCRPLSSSHRPASISVANNSSYRCIVCSHPLCRASPISFASYSGNCSTSFFSFANYSGYTGALRAISPPRVSLFLW